MQQVVEAPVMEQAEEPSMDALVERYIELRDAKAELKARYTERVSKLDEIMARIEVQILTHFQKHGGESFKTKKGTAYKSKRTSVRVQDWDAVLDFIRKHELWSMLEKRVSKAAVEQYKEENDEFPPGVDIHEEVVINVRRS